MDAVTGAQTAIAEEDNRAHGQIFLLAFPPPAVFMVFFFKTGLFSEFSKGPVCSDFFWRMAANGRQFLH